MLRALAGLVFLLVASASPALAQTVGPAPILCNQSFEVSQAAVALTKIVSNVANKQISVCGWSVNAGAAAGAAQLETGSGTNCGTNTAALTPPIALGINGVYVDHPPYAWTSLPRGTDLCLVTTGTGPTAVTVYYGVY